MLDEDGVVLAAGAAALECFLCFFTLFVEVVVDLLELSVVGLEAAGA